MKTRLLTTVLAIAALSSGVAMAQPDHKGDNKPAGGAQGGQHPGGQQGGGQHAGGTPGGARQGGQGGGGGQGHQGGAGGQTHTVQTHTTQVHTGAVFGGQAPVTQTTAPQSHGTAGAHHGAYGGGRTPATTQTFGAPMRSAGGDRGAAGRQFQYRGQQRQAINRGDYRYPSGYGYRRWNDGQVLPFLFLTQSYFFNDYANYGFGPPPYGYVWVRYGPDLLLVSRRTGRIRDVIYGVFY